MTFRVLFLDHTAECGGGEIALRNLILHLNPRTVVPVVVLCADGPVAKALRPIVDTHVLALSHHVTNTRKNSLGLTSLLRIREITSVIAYVLRLARFIRRNEIDLVHTNSLKADIIGGLAGRLSLCPVVWHVRDRIEEDYLPRPVVRIFRLLCKCIPRLVIANSFATLRTLHLQEIANDSASIGDHRNERSAVVHDGTDVMSSPSKPKEDRESFRIGLIGRISPWKGQDIFLQAAAHVHERFPQAQFVIVGSALFGEDKYEEHIRQLAVCLGIKDVVHFTGFCSDVIGAIAELDLVVHASTTGEPFGQVIIEGMAAGKPVIATDGGGVPEIVQNGETGILVPMGNVQAMADAICQLVADPALATVMGLRGRQRVQEHFTMEQTAQKVEAIYEAILGNNEQHAGEPGF